jgi:glycosyltransferase involved in cell wall biosynthesis
MTIDATSDVAPVALRITAVIPTSTDASAMIFAQRQVRALKARGHEIDVFPLPERRRVLGLLKAALRYRCHLREIRPDIVHVHYGAMTGFFSVFAATGLAPVVVTFRGSDLNPSPSMGRLRSLASHLLSHCAAFGAKHAICVSQELRGRLNWLARKSTVIPTGVDTTRFFPGNRTEARTALGWPMETPVVLFNAGRNPQVKRLDLAQAAVSLATETVPNLRFVVLDGTMPPDQVPTLMQASDCLLLTSDFEGSPTVVQEAMACNLPVVSVPVGDVGPRLKKVHPSYVVTRAPDDLARALVAALAEPRRSNGYEVVTKELGNEAIVSSLEKVYLKALPGRSRRPAPGQP